MNNRGCLAGCLSPLLVLAVLLMGGYAYYRAYPSMRGVLFVALGLLVLGVVLSLPRLIRAHDHGPDATTRCRECGQESSLLEWCTYSTGLGQRHSWLCRDCQNWYHAYAEA